VLNIVEGNLEDAGSEGFKRLFRYISGDNRSGDKVAMTAPVSQQPTGERIKMTAPVGQQRLEDWSEKSYLRYKIELESWIDRMGLTIVGDPIWARYNPPFMPWFLRRNEVLIPVDAGTD
jgi:hypothetical protein